MFDAPTKGRGSSESANLPKPGWYDEYAADYRYRYGWVMFGLPLLSIPLPFALWRAWGLGTAVMVALGACIVFVLVAVEWKTYFVRIGGGALNWGSSLHSRTIQLVQIQSIEYFHSTKGQRIIYVRKGRRTVLTVFAELDGFDDLLGFLRVYTKHHHIPFLPRGDIGNRSNSEFS